ncbi:ROK family protein [Paenibacillus solisilvae]|uniref:ROK family protein n=1 Tax=Paenibacillus solisilvae TaxID=2486751 RepID=A0ABW0WAQ2_9BACL
MNNEIRDQKGSKTSILQTLRMKGSMSRIELTRITGLSRATISTSIAELMEYNLVYETDNRQTTGGRPATSLELVPYSNIIIGVDFDHNLWTIGAFDLLGNVIKTITIPVNASSPEMTFKVLSGEIKDFIKTLDRDPIPLLGIGVPGLVSESHSIITSAAQLNWYHIDVEKIMREEIGWPTVVLNRYRARGLTECRYGSGQSFSNLAYIGVGTGVAAGLYIDRQLLSGSLGGAGEIGHFTIEPEGPLCPCGNQGCLQALCSGPVIEQEFRRLLRSGEKSVIYSDPSLDMQLLKTYDICAVADQGDALAIKVVNQAAAYLGIAMANLVNLFNPEAIILGGAIPNSSRLFVETATKIMKQRAMSSLSAATKVKTSSFKDIGGALGAANFALDKNMSMTFFNNNGVGTS